jgi:molecular chaperone GrpE
MIDNEKTIKTESAAGGEKPKKKKKLTLIEKYALLQAEYDEMKDRWMRNVAEFDNFRRRNIAEKSDWIKNANERMVLEFCDVLDNFERALHPEIEKNRESFEKGIELIFQQLEGILKRER